MTQNTQSRYNIREILKKEIWVPYFAIAVFVFLFCDIITTLSGIKTGIAIEFNPLFSSIKIMILIKLLIIVTSLYFIIGIREIEMSQKTLMIGILIGVILTSGLMATYLNLITIGVI